MNKEAKIHLSALESELVINTQWIFTKQIIIKKVQLILGVFACFGRETFLVFHFIHPEKSN